MIYIFGDCEFDLAAHVLHCAGQPVHIRPKVFQVIAYLLTHRARVITKQELSEQVWPGQFISDTTLETTIGTVRRAIGDSGQAQRYIQTLRGYGYRFVAPVEEKVVAPVTNPAPVAALPGPEGVANTPALPDNSVVPRSEYKVVTIMCGVMSPALPHIAELALDDLYTWVQALEVLVQRLVQPYEGTLYQMAADRFTVVFGAPQAQEDHALRALLAAIALQQQWPEFIQAQVLAPVTGLALGIGAHTGRVIVESPVDAVGSDLTIVGEALLLAIRLAEQVAPGSALVSAATAQGAAGDTHLEAQPPVLVTGFPSPIDVYRVVPHVPLPGWSSPSQTRGGSHFVGRDDDLTTLQMHLARVRAGQGQVVGVMGEPGIGKSRLLAEFRKTIQEREVGYMAGACQSYGRTTPYLPLIGLLRQLCALNAADDTEACTRKVRASLQALGIDPDVWASLLLHVMGLPDETGEIRALSPQAYRAQTFEALHQLLRQASQSKPLVVEVENVHWIDTASEAYLSALVPQLSHMPLMLLLTYRAGYQPPWGSTSNVTQLALSPLTPQDTQQLVQGLLTPGQLAPEVYQAIIAKANGNPLFLEELAQAVQEQGGTSDALALPETIQAVLMTRIDNLSPEAKDLLQTAAVLGPDVPLSLLKSLVSLPEEMLLQHMQYLEASELLYARHLAPEVTYTFKHVLTQEVAYQSLLRHSRQFLHAQVAEVLTTQCPELSAIQPEWVAHHLTEAGDGKRAIGYWLQAGQRANERSAHVEAIAHLNTGLEILKPLSPTPERGQQELDLHMALGPALMATKGLGAAEVERAYSRAWELGQSVDDPSHLTSVLVQLAGFYDVQAEFQTAHEITAQLLTLAQRDRDPALFLIAHQMLGEISLWRGELIQARAHLEHGLDVYDPQQHAALVFLYGLDFGVLCLICIAWTLWYLGYPDQALQRNYEALALAQKLSFPLSLADAQYFLTILHVLRGELSAAQEQAEALVTFASEEKFPCYLAGATFYQNWGVVMQGQGMQSVPRMRQALENWRDTMGRLGVPRFLFMMAQVHKELGQTEEGLAAVAEAMAMAEDTEQRHLHAELYRLKGELLFNVDDGWRNLTPEACFQKALDIAHRQNAKSLELRAATSLARLWQSQDKHQDAYDLLAPVYHWFTEGFDTADLLDAKRLLNELAMR
jgi:DNA-binding winged helix-turn-helix (wHTH) protein/class 3 adenylate cyclase/predicted ATPase